MDIIQQSNRDWQQLTSGNPVPSPAGPSVALTPSDQPGPTLGLHRVPSPPTPEDQEDQDADQISYLGHPVSELTAAMAQEGGAPLINFLLAKAIPPADEHVALPSTQSVKDWNSKTYFISLQRGNERNGRKRATKN